MSPGGKVRRGVRSRATSQPEIARKQAQLKRQMVAPDMADMQQELALQRQELAQLVAERQVCLNELRIAAEVERRTDVESPTTSILEVRRLRERVSELVQRLVQRQGVINHTRTVMQSMR